MDSRATPSPFLTVHTIFYDEIWGGKVGTRIEALCLGNLHHGTPIHPLNKTLALIAH